MQPIGSSGWLLSALHFLCCAQAQPAQADDPTGGYMLQAGARICKSLGEEFLPYLGIVMPPLLASAQLKPDVRVSNAGSDEDDAGDDADDDVRAVHFCMCITLKTMSHLLFPKTTGFFLSCLRARPYPRLLCRTSRLRNPKCTA